MIHEPGLRSLLNPLSSNQFFLEYWPKRPFVTHELGESVKALTSLPFLASLEALLNVWPKPVSAHLPDARDESSAVDVSPQVARKLFANQMGLLFNNAETISPELKLWISALRHDLGLPVSTYGRCLVYATPNGQGTATHFDQNINFVLQLHGTKKWVLTPNTAVKNPTGRHTLAGAVDLELSSYASENLDSIEGPQTEFTLRPGSLLFVPRGYWHSTTAEGNALALNFTFSQPTWIDLLTSALRSRLLQSPEWRGLADGVNSQDPERRELATQEFSYLLSGLVEDLPNWNADEILAATEGRE